MKRTFFLLIALLFGASLSFAKPERQGDPVAPPANLGQALDQLLAGKGDLNTVRLDVRWTAEEPHAFAIVHGNGIGIWRNEKQFTLTQEQMRGLLQEMQKAKFAAFPSSFGGLKFPKGGPRPGVPERLIGGITLTIGNARHSSQQLGGGEQSQALADLANRLLAVCARLGQKGVGADSLADGLQKIVNKDLDPLTLSVMVHRIQNEGNGPDGWLFRVEGQTVITRTRSAKGYATPIRYELSRKELESLIKLLADNGAGNLPINLFATEYTDFDVKVLNRNKNLQARRFARLTPQTHGERQKQFDRIFAGLHEIHQHALKNGKAEPEPK